MSYRVDSVEFGYDRIYWADGWADLPGKRGVLVTASKPGNHPVRISIPFMGPEVLGADLTRLIDGALDNETGEEE